MYDETTVVDYIIMRHISSSDMKACQEQAQESTPGACYVAVSMSDGFTTDGELDDEDDDDDYDDGIDRDATSANSSRDIVRSATSCVEAVSFDGEVSSANEESCADEVPCADEVSSANEVSRSNEVSSADSHRSCRDDLTVVAVVSDRDDTDDNSATSGEL